MDKTLVELIAEVEAAGYSCWPAKEMVGYDGWELRYADGFSGRANSVLPLGESTLALDTKLRFCGEWFEERGVQLEVRCTPLCEPGIDDDLDARGYAIDRPTRVMSVDLAGAADTVSGGQVSVAPDDRWWRAMAGLWGISEERQIGWKGIIGRILPPAAYVLVADGGRNVAGGHGVVAGSWLALFGIVVAPEWRRRGYGRKVTTSLLAWGAAQGAQRAFLQVVASNKAAIALYRDLGFRDLYDYWYRREPANNPA